LFLINVVSAQDVEIGSVSLKLPVDFKLMMNSKNNLFARKKGQEGESATIMVLLLHPSKFQKSLDVTKNVIQVQGGQLNEINCDNACQMFYSESKFKQVMSGVLFYYFLKTERSIIQIEYKFYNSDDEEQISRERDFISSFAESVLSRQVEYQEK